MHFKKLFLCDNKMMPAINGHDITRPLGIYFKPFVNNVHDIKYHNWCSANGGEGIIACEHSTLHSSNTKNLEMVCNLEATSKTAD